MSADLKFDPAEGECPHCRLLKERQRLNLCAQCGLVAPVNSAVTPHHVHLEQPSPTAFPGSKARWDPVSQNLCVKCYEDDYQKAYGKKP